MMIIDSHVPYVQCLNKSIGSIRKGLNQTPRNEENVWGENTPVSVGNTSNNTEKKKEQTDKAEGPAKRKCRKKKKNNFKAGVTMICVITSSSIIHQSLESQKEKSKRVGKMFAEVTAEMCPDLMEIAHRSKEPSKAGLNRQEGNSPRDVTVIFLKQEGRHKSY